MRRQNQKENAATRRKIVLPESPLSQRGAEPADESIKLVKKERRQRSISLKREKWPVHERRSLKIPDVDDGDFVSRRPASQRGQTVSPEGVSREKASRQAASRERVSQENASQEPRKKQGGAAESPQRQRRSRRSAPKKDKVQIKLDERGWPIGMSEPPEPTEEEAPPEPKKIKLLRAILCLAILAIAAGFFLAWEDHTRQEDLPPLVMPQPYFYEEEQPVRGLLLWHERVLSAPDAGTVQLAAGGHIATVSANDVVATVISRGSSKTVRAPGRGYFVPGLDGAEDNWIYNDIWPGSDLLPNVPKVVLTADLSAVKKGQAIGKLVTLPQRPRVVCYIDLTPPLRESLQHDRISIRFVSRGPKWTVPVRTHNEYGSRSKIYIELPLFPIEMSASREINFFVCSDEDSGLSVPESAVVIRNGQYGVFELIADMIHFTPITGKPLKDGRFFVSSGLNAGNPVILDGSNTDEKRVRLW